MKYMLIMEATKSNWDTFLRWPKTDLQAHMAFMESFTKELSDAKELVAAEGLDMPGEAKVVRAGKNGAPVTTDVFPESKEFLAGYWIVEVDTPERAYQIAAAASAAPGPGGQPMNMPILVRQVMSGPPEELL
ncbi:MAG: YciI family protein [Longimicrobiales bacterium]